MGAGTAFAAAPSTPVNNPPALTVPGAQTIVEGSLLTFNVSATDPDGQSVDLRAANLPMFATFVDHHNNTGTFSWTPQSFQAGSYIVFFTADDTFGGVTTRSVTIDAVDANNAPVLDPISDRTVDAGSTIIVMATGSDPDGDALSYTTAGVPLFGSFTDFGDGTGSLRLAPGSAEPSGTYPITLTLSDGIASDSQSFTLSVAGTAVQHAPVLSPIGNQTVAEGATRSVSVSAGDVDGGILTWSVSLPGFASLTPTASGPGVAQASLGLAPGYCAAGSYPASVSVSDGSLSASQSFSIQVSNVNRTPVWGGPYAASLLEGASADVPVSAADPDQACGAPAALLTIVSSNGGSALTASLSDAGNGTGTLHLSAAQSGVGSYQVTLRASDPTDGTATPETQVSVTVGHVNRCPAAVAGGPYSGVATVAVAFLGSGSDPDGDALQFTWNFGDGTQGAGASASHAYANAGAYIVVLTASDGSLSDQDSTAASVSSTYAARVWSEPGTIRLYSGKPRETVLLEPMGGSWDLRLLDLSTLELCAPPGMGAVSCISPLPGKTTANRDRDHNGVPELAMEFSKDDLRLLFANLTERTSVSLTVNSNLVLGGALRAGLTIDVIPEKHRTLRRVSPNPLNPQAVITLGTDRPGPVRLQLYDLSGRLVRTLIDVASWPAGDHDVTFDGRDAQGKRLSSGRYFLRAEASGTIDSAPITVLK
jgi:PKD domain-containing protein/flagellar hook capping protein FlgD/putative Ig domain-containing protein/Big-like domain-containing protein